MLGDDFCQIVMTAGLAAGDGSGKGMHRRYFPYLTQLAFQGVISWGFRIFISEIHLNFGGSPDNREIFQKTA